MTMELKHCCGQPPRLISGEGYGYSLICMECGLGTLVSLPMTTYQSAEYAWAAIASFPSKTPTGPVKVLLKELNEANEVLRNIAYVLGAGGYNAPVVDAEKFGEKIHAGIKMLVDPLETMIAARDKRIAELEAENIRLKSLVGDEVIARFERAVEDDDKAKKLEVVVTATVGYTYYELRRDGYVNIRKGDNKAIEVRHVHNIGRDAQVALESAARNHVKKEEVNVPGDLRSTKAS